MGRTRKRIRKASRQKAVDGDDRSKTAAQAGFLPKEAYAILRTYCTQVTRHPTKDQFQELVTGIQRIPGCENCQIRKLRAYFKERRKTEARAAEHKARNHPKSVDTIEATKNPSPSPRRSTTAAEPDAPSMPSSSSSHLLQDPFPSCNNGVPTTFINLTRWLQEQDTRFTDFTPLRGAY